MATQGGYTFQIRLGRPIDLGSSLSGLGRSGDDLIDRFDGRTLIRSIRLAADAPAVAYRADIGAGLADRIEVTAPAGSDTDDLVAAIAATFVLDTDALDELCATDQAVAAVARRHPGHVPVLFSDALHALIRSISAQQVNLRWAATIRARLAQRYGTRLTAGAGDDFVHVLDAAALAVATIDDLRQLQLTNAKARSVIAVARAARDGELRLPDLAALDDEALVHHLTQLPGIGRWSAEWFLARTLGRPRVVAGDLGVRKAVGRLYGVGMPSETEVRRLTEHWGAAATVAQALVLHDLALSPVPAPIR